jgi:hypothetical protein
MHDLAVAKLHDAHRVGRLALVGDGVLRDPEIAVADNSPDIEARRLAGMMTPQGLQIGSPKDALAGLGIIADGVVSVNAVFRICVAGCRGLPVGVQGLPYLFVWRGGAPDAV